MTFGVTEVGCLTLMLEVELIIILITRMILHLLVSLHGFYI